MNWQDVQRLRKDGQLEQARDASLKILAADPQDFKTKSEYEWVIFGYIKLSVTAMREAMELRPVDERDVSDLMGWMEEYRNADPRIPGMACSNILAQLAKVGAHLPKFPGIMLWADIDRLRPEDWLPNEYQGKTLPSLGTNIARALCKWANAHPKASRKQMDLALSWSDRAKQWAKGDDALWLNWDMAILLRQMGDFLHAAELLTDVVKAKRNEFWVWAEAARLYRSEQPDLALACFCRALECPADRKFMVRAHRELAELLAELGEYAQASLEVAKTVDIRQTEGWPVGRELEGLIASPWYDPSAEGAEEAQRFYRKHSSRALALCFDVVETKAATYLGLLVPQMPKDPKPGWKPRPLHRFAFKDVKGHAWSFVGPGMKNLQFELGTPLTVIIGRQNVDDDRQTIVHVTARADGTIWDCLERGAGVVTREASVDRSTRVFVAGLREEGSIHLLPEKPLRLGGGVQFGIVRNPKNNLVELHNVVSSKLPEEDVKRVLGQLRRKHNGSGNVEDAYVPPHLVETVASAVSQVVALAVFAWNQTKNEYSWKVVTLCAE